MANPSQSVTISLTSEQIRKLEALKKLTGHDDTNVFRAALENYYEKVMADEDGKELAKINAFLDVQ